ncbi:MAG TPA: CHASE3 domain-containing protein [Streptosporangiaceae bacterium]|jgi:signal transduction histidine kinase
MPRIWAHRGLARRTIITSVCLSLVIGAAFSFLGLAISWLRGSAGQAGHSQEVLIATSRLEQGVIDIETGERGFVITGQPRFLQPWFAAMAEFHGQSMTLERLTAEGGARQAKAARRLVQATDSYIKGYSIPTVVTARMHPAAARTVAMTAAGKNRIDVLRDEFSRFTASERRIFVAEQDRAIAAAHRATIGASAGVAGSILLILFCGGYLVRSVVQPVRRASAMARGVAGGDLTARMTETGPAEVGVLGQSLNAMAGSLADSRADLQRIAADQAALRRVATLVARGVPPAEVFTAVAAEIGRILAAECTVVARREPDGALRVDGSWAREEQAQPAPPPGSRWPAGTESRPGPGREAGQAELAGSLADWARERGMRSSVSAPITTEGHLWGVVIAFARTCKPYPEHAESRILGFAKLAAMAIANSDSRAQLIASRARVVSAADKARRQIERNLHDGTQQRLISLALELRTTEDRIPAGQEEIAERLSRTAQGLADVVEELRQISQGLHPVLLEKGGLGPALRALARRSGLEVELNLHLGRRLPEPVETAVYYVVAEALTNTAKHAAATARVRIDLGETAGTVRLLVRDDGPGGADPGRGSGLIGLTDRVEAIGGAITVTSPAGGGTTLAVTIAAGARAVAAAASPAAAAW